MFQWLWSKVYDNVMKNAQARGLREWRCELLKNCVGDVVELGCGTGANLEFYPETVNSLTLIEPNLHMHQTLKQKILQSKLKNIALLNDQAEFLSLKDASADIVVSTLVLCSVKNVEKTLFEIYRILRPQGKFIFIEHVAALNNPKRYQWQRRLNFLWQTIANGCHLTRCTESSIIKAGFKIVELKSQSMRGVPPVVRPSIRGIAIKV